MKAADGFILTEAAAIAALVIMAFLSFAVAFKAVAGLMIVHNGEKAAMGIAVAERVAAPSIIPLEATEDLFGGSKVFFCEVTKNECPELAPLQRVEITVKRSASGAVLLNLVYYE